MGRIGRVKLHEQSETMVSYSGACSRTIVKYGSYLGFRSLGRTWMLHVCVAECFIPNPENKPMVNHKDGNKRNPRGDNLEWVTRSENVKHAYALGLKKRDNAKLSPKQVKAIRRSKKSPPELALKYNISVRSVQSVISRRTWDHI